MPPPPLLFFLVFLLEALLSLPLALFVVSGELLSLASLHFFLSFFFEALFFDDDEEDDSESVVVDEHEASSVDADGFEAAGPFLTAVEATA